MGNCIPESRDQGAALSDLLHVFITRKKMYAKTGITNGPRILPTIIRSVWSRRDVPADSPERTCLANS